jgi:hypothetical protein
MQTKYAKLLDDLEKIKADDELIHKHSEKFAVIIEDIIFSYHQELKNLDKILINFNTVCQKQLFKFKNFLVGVATVWEYHLDSYKVSLLIDFKISCKISYYF